MPATLITIDASGLKRLQARLQKVAHPNVTPLMIHWMKVIDDDNRKGVMAGLDKRGFPMVPVTYRPAPSGKLGRVHKRRQAYNPGIGGNLTSEQYRRLAGPPLAPRGMGSRVVTNLKTAWKTLGRFRYEAFGYWDDVVSRKGIPFLVAHFEGRRTGRAGATKLPVRDLRGLRPDGKSRAHGALRAWMIDVIRSG